MSAAERVARLVADLADRGGRLRLNAEGLLVYRGPPLSDEVRSLLREHGEALKGFLRRDRFDIDELRALGFLGEPDGSGRYVVRVRAGGVGGGPPRSTAETSGAAG